MLFANSATRLCCMSNNNVSHVFHLMSVFLLRRVVFLWEDGVDAHARAIHPHCHRTTAMHDRTPHLNHDASPTAHLRTRARHPLRRGRQPLSRQGRSFRGQYFLAAHLNSETRPCMISSTRPPLSPALGASYVCLVDENPTCSVPAL